MTTRTEKQPQKPRRTGSLLIDAEEVAEMIGTSRRHVLDLAARDQLPHVQVGRFVRFRRPSIEAWAELTERGLGDEQPQRGKRGGR
jgi:excisionase family DNA binding protein